MLSYQIVRMASNKRSTSTTAGFDEKLGAAGAEGVDYQLNLIMIALFRATDKYKENFEIFSEILVCEKFDDLVLRYKGAQQNERYRLVQVKHALDETKTICYDQLAVGDKFGIEKFFNAYKTITQDERFRDKIDDLILFHNLDKSNELDPYLETVPTEDPIFDFPQAKRNGKFPRVYKLNSKFIMDYKYSMMKKLAKVLISLCIKNLEIKARNETMKGVHMRLSTDVISIEEGRFRSNFILREELSSGTADFRDIFDEELQMQVGDFSTISERNIWMQNVHIRLCPDFGKKGNISQQPWPIKLNEPGDEELFDQFCSQFTLRLCQPNEEELEELIRKKCDQYFQKSTREGAFDIINGKLRRWFKSSKEPLDQKFLLEFRDRLDELIAENESNKEMQHLLPQSIIFENNSYPSDLRSFMNDKAKKLFQVTTSGCSKLCALKLLNNINLFVATDYLFTSKTTRKHLVEIMQIIMKSLSIHVLVWEITKKERNSGILADLISRIEDKPLKKLIIITNDDSKNIISNLKIESYLMDTVDGTPRFNELSLKTRNQILHKIVKFQGHPIKFNEIYPRRIPGENADTSVWGNLLERDVIIGRELILSEEYNLKHYINRTLTQMPSTANAVKLTVNDNQQNLLNHFAKVLLVSDTAGMGKTTISSHLVQEFKRQSPHLWVARLVALDCTNELREFDSMVPKDGSPKKLVNASYDNFIMNKLLKLTSPIEKFVFQQYLQNEYDKGQLILMFDGYDEINLKCRRAIVAILQYLGAKCNVRLIGITTRGQFGRDLEVMFQQHVFTLEPFTQGNKLDFLKRFWSSSESPSNIERLEDYARQLIETISRTISEEESQLTGIPLQMRMLGEIFVDKAKRFEKNGLVDAAVFSSIGLYELYERFIEKKKNIYLAEKLGINAGAASREELLEPILKTQSKYAQTMILSSKKIPTIEKKELEKVISLGIIHKHRSGTNFIHRTFAEFLVAEHLLQEYYQKNGVPVTKILRGGDIVKILSAHEFSIVRQFINSQLNQKRLLKVFCQEKYRKVLSNAFVRVFERISGNSIAEGTSGLLKFTLEFYWWLNSQALEDNLFGSCNKPSISVLVNSCLSITSKDEGNFGLMQMAFEKPTVLSVIFEFIIDKSVNSQELLMRTLKFLIQSVIFANVAGRKNRDRLINSLIDFQKRLLDEELIDYDTFQFVVLNAGADEAEHNFWNTCSVMYLESLRINHNSLLVNFLKGKPYLILQMIQYGRTYDCKNFFEIHENLEIDLNYIYDNFVENVFDVLEYWYERPNIRLYFKMLQGHVRNFRDTYRLDRFEIYLEEFRERCKINIMSDEVFLEFLLSIRHSIRDDNCLHRMKIHESLKLIENSALWGSTMTLELILATGDIELGVIDRLQSEQHEDISLTTRRILAVIRGTYAGSEFIPILSVRCSNRHSILQSALLQDMPLKVNIFTSWITSDDVFSCLMEVKCHQPIENFDLFLRFVDQKLSQYRLRYFEINFDEIVHHACHSDELLRIFETVSVSDFMELILVQSRDGVLLLQAFTFIKDDAEKLLALIKQKILTYIAFEDIKELYQKCNMETEVAAQAAIDYLASIDEPEKRERLEQIVSHINEIMFLLIIYHEQLDEQDQSKEMQKVGLTEKDSQEETVDDIMIEEGVAEMGAEEAANRVAVEDAIEAFED